MQRFHAGSCNSAVNNGAISGIQSRDASRVDSSAVQPNFSQNSRRSSQLSSYKLRCDKEQLNPRLGPPDFHPVSPHCPEETLTREYAQSGYRDTIEGLEENREIVLSHLLTIKKPTIIKCKEAIKKCHRAINESRAQKRKAGQVYGVPLSGALLTKPGIFPEQRPSGEDFRKKWIEGLSQPHKRLRSLADHVPHGYRRKSLFEVLIRNNVPLVRATWFIKVTYLNQIRASSSSNLSGFHDKTQISRSEQWTKDVIEYMQNLLDEFIARNNTHSNFHIRDRLSQSVYVGSVQPKSDSFSTFMDGEEPSLYTKWWYMVRIIHWHHAEGLVIPSLIIDWVLHQLQEKEFLCVLQLLLPIIYGVIETVVLSQTYVRILVGLAVRFIQEPSPGGSDLVNNSRRAYTTSAVVEMLRYLILAVPDSFVALDCFPLPKCVVSHVVNDGSFLAKTADDSRNMKDGLGEVAGVLKDKYQSEFLSFHSAVASIQKRAETLSRVASPNHPGHGVAKASQVLDQALVHGDIGEAYKLFFETIWDGACADRWIEQVSPCLHTLLSQMGTVTSSVLSSMFFICEWATCEYRDFRSAPHGLKFSGRKDFSQIYIAIRLLKRKMSNMPNLYSMNRKNNDISSIFETLGPFHDVIVCWIDQHEVHNGEGFKRLQLLIRELIRSGIFNPHAYVRQLIVSGILDENGPMVDLKRRKRHYKLLKELPASYVRDVMGENQIAEPLILLEASKIYSNERRLVLHGLLGDMNSTRNANSSTKKQKHLHVSGSASASPSPIDQWLPQTINKSKTNVETNLKLEELKASICTLLQLPFSSLSSDGVDESQSNIKRPGVIYNRTDIGEEASGCEECSRVKRQKLNDERSSHLQSNPADDEDLWWVNNKGLMHMESFKVEQPPKPAKQASRGRQKSVRKTQSLAQLASARIEGSQGASTSHVCESRIGCPHHRSTSDDVLKSIDGVRKASGDIISIGKLLKKMKFVGKRSLTEWLIITVKELIEEAEKTAAKVVQFGKPSPAVDDRSSSQWRLGEDELSAILYVMDVCDELVSATRFLLWLLTKVPSNPGSTIHSRNIMMPHKIAENHVCEVGEAFIISTIRRYENILAAADLIPEILTATMRRTSSVLASNGRLSSSPSFLYACHLLRKYSNVATVVEWEKAFKPTFDKRLSSELESGRSLEGDFGFPLGVPNGVEDLDDYFRQKISGIRVSRVGLNMNQIVHRHVDEAFHNFFNSKDRKPFGQGTNKSSNKEKLDDCYPIARKIVTGLMDCIRQTGGAAQEGDPSLVSSAIAAIVNNVGQAIARIPDLTPSRNCINVTSPSGSLQFARRILRIHITCLCLLKEALGERQSRVFEVALATEASSSLMQAFAPGKAPRGQFQMSPESLDFNPNLPNEAPNFSSKSVIGKAARITAAVSALVIGAILQGVASLDRMVTLFKLKEGLDLMNHFTRTLKSNMNGNARSSGVLKVDNLIEISVNWFRVLVGNCRTVSDGFIVELLGEPSVVALSRMQRMLSLNLVLPPAYSIFAFVLWRPALDASIALRENLHHLLAVTMLDTLKHLPFREICLRDSHGLYDLVAADTLDSEFLSVLESNGIDINLKAAAMVPLRSRLFLDALIDCKMPPVLKIDEGKRVSGQGELKKQCGDNMKKLVGKLVNILDTMQPARFHWQWVELRLLLNEQAVNEKMMENDISLSDALRSLTPNLDKCTASDNESNFILVLLTRLLVRPDAAPLFSEAVHLLGKSLEDSMLSQAKWLLKGTEVLYGKKSIRQKVINIASELKELSLKPQYWKPWGWCSSDTYPVNNKRDKRKSEAEEGEVVDERTDFNKGSGILDVEGYIVSQQHVTERALIELILPCLDQGSDKLRHNFASEMINQMSNIEQQINVVTRGVGKLPVVPSSAIGSPGSKSSNRKSGKGSSPGISRQSAGSAETVPPSPAALRASLTLRLEFLLRLLPVICSDREPSGRNMRYVLAAVVLRLLGSRIVHEDDGHFINPAVSLKRNVVSPFETSAANELQRGESLFGCLLLVLHVLLSSYQPSWLKLKSVSKHTESNKDYAVFDREVAESLQNDLDRMELPETIRWRIQTAMPILFSSVRNSISCQPPSVSHTALSCLQPSIPVTVLTLSNLNPPQRNSGLPARAGTSLRTKPQTLQSQDLDAETDPWTILEHGGGSGQSPVNSTVISGSDNANLKASNLLKGAVRVRRTDLSYIGTVDEDS